MDKIQDKLILKGYIEGYKDGLRDGKNGKGGNEQYREFKTLPIRLLPLSTRARNCLSSASCKSVVDIVALTEVQIARVRNLGIVTAREIAAWLTENGIFDSAWCKYR